MNKNLCLNDSEREWVLKVKSILSKPQPPIPTPPNNEIWYRSSDENVITPFSTSVFGANIVSNVYEDGIGIITFDGDVTSIGDYVFQNCKSLTSIIIPNSVTSIGNSAFRNCTGLTSINIPDSVTSIDYLAFRDCTGLTFVALGNSITSINDGAFQGCTGLTSITIPNKVASIGSRAFESCISLTSIVVSNDNAVYDSRDNCNAIIETSTNKLILGCKNTIIPDSVTSIGENAFISCINLTSITIPNSVTSIGARSFQGCINLTSITIGNSVESIGSNAFASCISLTSIVVSNDNTVYDSRDNCNAIIETSTNKLILGCKNTIIPNSVTSIGNNTFENCTDLTSINIPNSVTNIGQSVFNNCTGLTSVTIGNKVTSIGRRAFNNCTGLTSITFLSTTPPTIQSNTLPSHKTYIIYVPAGDVETYKAAQYWSSKESQIEAIQ